MEKKSKFLKNLLTTASTIAVLTGGVETAFGAAGDGFSRPVANAAKFGNAALEFHNDSGGAAAAFTNNNNFINSRVDNLGGVVALSTDTAARNINSFNLYGNGNATLTIGVDAGSLGSVYNDISAGATTQNAAIGGALANPAAGTNAGTASMLKLILGGNATGYTTTLTGTGGVVNGFNIPVDSYDNLGEINFGTGNNVLVVNAGSGNPITLNNATVTNAANAASQLTLTTSLTVKDASFAGISKFKIADNKVLTFDVGNNNIATTVNSLYTYDGNDSTIVFKVNGTGGKSVNFGANFVPTGAATDNKGKLEFANTANGVANVLTVTSGAGKTIGQDDTHRLQELKFSGTGDVTLDNKITVFAKSIVQAGTGTATFTNAVDSGNNSKISYTAAGKLNFVGGLTTGDSTVNNDGTLILGADSNITVLILNKGTLDAAGKDLTGKLTVTEGTATVQGTSGDTVVTVGTITQTGTVGGKLEVGNIAAGGTVAKYFGGAGTNVTGEVKIRTDSTDVNTINNATAAVTVTKGKLKMNDAADDVTIVDNVANVLEVRDIAAGKDLLANGGVTTVRTVGRNVTLTNGAVVNQTGTINTGNLSVSDNSLFNGDLNATDVTAGGVTINTANTGMNSLHNVTAGAVTVNKGNLTMNDIVAVGAGDITVDGVTGGATATVNKVGRNALVKRGGVLSVTGDIGGTLNNDAGDATVKLTGAGTVTGEVGGTSKITKIIVSANRTFTAAKFNVKELNFAADSKVSLTAADLAGIDVTLDKDGVYHIEVNADQNITGKINAAGKAGLDIKVNGAHTATLDTDTFKSDLFAAAPDELTLVIGNNFVSGGKLGSQTARLLKTTFDNNNLVTVGDIYSKAIEVNAGKKAKSTGKVVGETLTLTDADSAFTFADGTVLDSKIVAKVAGAGLVSFEGSATINSDIGAPTAAVKSVKFLAAAKAAPAEAMLNKDIYSTEIDAGNTALVASSNVKLIGTTKAKYIDLQSNTLTVGGTELQLTGDTYLAVTVSDASGSLVGGQLVVIDGAAVNVTGVTSATILIDDTNNTIPVEGRQFTLLSPGTGKITGAFKNFAVINEQSLTKWDALVDAKGNVVLTQRNDAVNVLTKDLGNNAAAPDLANMQALIGSAETFKELANMQTPEARTDMIKRIVATDVGNVLSDVTTRVGADLGARMGALAGSQGSPVQSKIVSAETTGLSAGDEANRYGAWLSPFFNKATQKSRKGAAGYSATTTGASFGFDTKANDDMIVGLALSLLNTEVKHKDFKSGDKTKADSLMFSIYGMQQITDNWFAQGLVTFGSNRVTTNEKRRTGDAASQQASGKYTSMSFSGEALAGYNYAMEQMSITPMGGIRVTKVNDGGYKETGTTNQNLTISKKALNKAELIAGVRVAGGTFNLNGMTVTPEIHGFVNHDMIGKNPKVDMRLNNGTLLSGKSAKPSKTAFNAGVGLNATYNSMEYGLGYDAHMANKYIGHQGTLKVRVNF